MPVLARLLVAATAVLALAAGSASAEERMWIGFHDDPVLRYGDDRQAELDKVRAANATIVRTLVDWAKRRAEEAGERHEPLRSRLPLRRPRRVRPQRAGAGWRC